MTSLEILNAVLPSPLHNNKAAARKLTKKTYCPNPLSVSSVCFGFVKTNRIKGNSGLDQTVTDSLEERESERRGGDGRMVKSSKNVWVSNSWCFSR